jgi:hypothetical protein
LLRFEQLAARHSVYLPESDARSDADGNAGAGIDVAQHGKQFDRDDGR